MLSLLYLSHNMTKMNKATVESGLASTSDRFNNWCFCLLLRIILSSRNGSQLLLFPHPDGDHFPHWVSLHLHRSCHGEFQDFGMILVTSKCVTYLILPVYLNHIPVLLRIVLGVQINSVHAVELCYRLISTTYSPRSLRNQQRLQIFIDLH